MSTVTQETLLIHQPSGDYPLKLADLRLRIEHCIVPDRIDSEALVEFGYFPVFESDMPTDGVPVESTPELKDGVYYRVWTTRPLTDAETATVLAIAKEGKLQEVLAFQQEQTNVGVPCLIGGTVYHVQVRSDQDISVVTNLRIAAKEAVNEAKEITFEFRMYENVNIELGAQPMLVLADHVLDQTQVGRKAIWALKDAVAASTTVDELPVIPDALFNVNVSPI